MKKRKLGTLEIEVSEVAFGGAGISSEGKGYSFGYISEEDAIALLREAYQRGINLFDTAPIYGHGVSEIRIGKAFKHDRDKVVLVSKSGVTWDAERRIRRTNDPVVTRKMLEQSLKDLDTDYIDLYMIHWPDAEVDIRKPIEVLVRAREEGKIRTIGLCNTHVEDLDKAREITPVVAAQNEFNLFNTGVRDGLFPYLEEHGIGFMSWATLDRGILTGRVTRERVFDSYDARGAAPWWRPEVVERKIDAMEAIFPVLEGHTGLELALGFVLSHAQVSAALCGIRSPEQLDTVLQACENAPRTEILQRAESIAREHMDRTSKE